MIITRMMVMTLTVTSMITMHSTIEQMNMGLLVDSHTLNELIRTNCDHKNTHKCSVELTIILRQIYSLLLQVNRNNDSDSISC